MVRNVTKKDASFLQMCLSRAKVQHVLKEIIDTEICLPHICLTDKWNEP